ncbi:MAG: hypothetical protein M1825_000999 [Sarcosagium campestre]|nr:MAG: hypothetical protein M1825_000999 [Sarcosagium campestre]
MSTTTALRERTSALTTRVQPLVNSVSTSIDRVFPPASRKEASIKATTFAQQQPLLATFLAVQLALSLLPIFLFITFALSTLIFAFSVTTIFALFWIGTALLVLVPALCIGFCVASLVWAWAVSCYVAARFVYGIVVARRSVNAAPSSSLAVVKTEEDPAPPVSTPATKQTTLGGTKSPLKQEEEKTNADETLNGRGVSPSSGPTPVLTQDAAAVPYVMATGRAVAEEPSIIGDRSVSGVE